MYRTCSRESVQTNMLAKYVRCASHLSSSTFQLERIRSRQLTDWLFSLKNQLLHMQRLFEGACVQARLSVMETGAQLCDMWGQRVEHRARHSLSPRFNCLAACPACFLGSWIKTMARIHKSGRYGLLWRWHHIACTTNFCALTKRMSTNPPSSHGLKTTNTHYLHSNPDLSSRLDPNVCCIEYAVTTPATRVCQPLTDIDVANVKRGSCANIPFGESCKVCVCSNMFRERVY